MCVASPSLLLKTYQVSNSFRTGWKFPSELLIFIKKTCQTWQVTAEIKRWLASAMTIKRAPLISLEESLWQQETCRQELCFCSAVQTLLRTLLKCQNTNTYYYYFLESNANEMLPWAMWKETNLNQCQKRTMERLSKMKWYLVGCYFSPCYYLICNIVHKGAIGRHVDTDMGVTAGMTSVGRAHLG